MNEREEQAFIRGGQAALRAMLGHALRELLSMGIPDDDKDVQIARLASELSDATATLRRVCAEHGDNDWPDDLSLPDVIEKHLARHLRDSKENAGTEPDEGARGRKRVGKTIIPTTLYNAIADMLGATDARDDTPELEALREVFVGCAAA